MPRQYRPWSDFVSALEQHFGTLQRAQTNFSEQTGKGMSTIQNWRKQDRVPDYAFTTLLEIDSSECSSSLFRGYHTQTLITRVVELSKQNKSLAEISTILSVEFDRKITESMVKGLRYRNKVSIPGYTSKG